MIKTSTVIKRMARDGWKPAVTIVGIVAALMGTSYLAEFLFGVDSNLVYWGLVLVWFAGTGIKWAYDMKRDQIAWEQKEMMRDLERKHL